MAAFVVAVLVVAMAISAQARTLEKAVLVVTCDDGHKSQWGDPEMGTGLAPILNKYKIVATSYPVTSWIDDDPQYMTHIQLQTLKSRGWEFGNHTRNHVDPFVVTDSVLISELAGAKQDLLSWGLGPVRAFAPPYGNFSSHIQELVKAQGMTSLRQAWTEDSDVNTPDSFNPLALNVISLKSTTDPAAVMAWLDKLAMQKFAGVIVIHEVDVAGDLDSIPSATVEQIFAHATSLIAQGNWRLSPFPKWSKRCGRRIFRP